jgi:hypothetical protein
MPIRKSSSNAEKKQRATRDMSATLKAESQKAKFSVCSESKPHQSDNLDNHQAQAEDELLAQPDAVASKVSNLNIEQEAGVQGAGFDVRLRQAQLPRSRRSPNGSKGERKSLAEMSPSLDWLIHFQRHSQLLMAVVEPGTFTLRYANDYFCSMMGIAATYSELGPVKSGYRTYCQT